MKAAIYYLFIFTATAFTPFDVFGQGYIFFRNPRTTFDFAASLDLCTGSNTHMDVSFGGQELQSVRPEACSTGTTYSIGNISYYSAGETSGRARGTYSNSNTIYWSISSVISNSENKNSGNSSISLIPDRIINVSFNAGSYYTRFYYNTEFLYTTNIMPKIITPNVTNNNAVHTESVTIVAPTFLTSNFSGNDIIWYKDGFPIEVAPKVYLTGTSLTINYKSDKSGDDCGMHRYLAKAAKYNWYSESIDIKFAPNLKVGYDLLIEQPSCVLSQSKNDTSKTLGKLSFGKSIVGRRFSIKIDNWQSGDLENSETEDIQPSTSSIKLKTIEILPSGTSSCPQYDTIFVLPPKSLSITSQNFHDIDCFGSTANYAIQLSGQAPKDTAILDDKLKYSLDKDKPFTIMGILKGKHTIKIKDQNGCAMDTTIVLTAMEPTKLVPNITIKHPLCHVSNGTATLTPKGGTSPYKFKFETDSSYTSTSTVIREAGNKLIPSVIDAKGCIVTLKDTTLKTPADFFPTATVTKHNRCYNDSIAEAKIVVKGNGRYAFSSDGTSYQPTPILTKLSTGKLTLYARNDSGCVKPATVTVNSMPKIDIDPLIQNDVTCKGFSDGSLYVQVSGGKGTKRLSGDSLTSYVNKASAYNYTFQNLQAHSYRTIATDDSGCTQKLDFRLKTRSDMKQSFSTVSPTCVLSPNGEASVTTTNGVKPYKYAWVGQGNKTNRQANLPQGTYIVTTTDSLYCTKTDTVKLVANIQIPVKLTGYPTLCKGQKLDLDPGHLGIAYTWKKGNKTLSTNRVLTVDTSGTYSVLVKDNLGCTGSDSLSVNYVDKEIKPSFIMTSKAVVGDMVMVAFNNVGYQSLSWSDTIPNTIAMDTTREKIKPYIFKQPGDYKVPMTMQMYNCKATIWKTIQIFPASEKQEVEESLGIRAKLVREVAVSPNPTRGEFNLKVDLNYENDATISLYAVSTSQLMASRQVTGKSSYTIPFNEDLKQGFYMVYIKVGTETAFYRVLVTND